MIFLPEVISRTLGFAHIDCRAAQQSRNKGRCNAKSHQAMFWILRRARVGIVHLGALEKFILKDTLKELIEKLEIQITIAKM
jgi:hypothetical protein